MRKSFVAGTAVAFVLAMQPQVSFAQEAPAAPSLSESVPLPDTEAYTGFWRITAISVGAVVGVIAANALTGGMITPIVAAGVAEAPVAAAAVPAAGAAAVDAVAAAPAAAVAAAPAAGAAVVDAAVAGGAAVANAGSAAMATGVNYTMMAYQGVTTLAGAIVGGYLGNWVYGN
jgi:hypothetical protein